MVRIKHAFSRSKISKKMVRNVFGTVFLIVGMTAELELFLQFSMFEQKPNWTRTIFLFEDVLGPLFSDLGVYICGVLA